MSTSARYLFIHQNFPGQFLHLALAKQGHAVAAIAHRGRGLPGIPIHRYELSEQAAFSAGRLSQLDTQLCRATAAAECMLRLKRQGYAPDVIVAHPGWGEAMFCKDVWPSARLVVFSEFFYTAQGADADFDPEFAGDPVQAAIGIRLKNTVHLHAYHAADAIYTPTEWQKAQIPAPYRAKARVIFDGIDTDRVRPDPRARIHLGRDGKTFRPGDEVLTFVNRNLEPYRGFHVFMRALPEILRRRPRAHAVIVGGDEVSYGRAPKNGGTWRQALLAEIGAHLPMERVHFVGKLPYAAYLHLLQVSACHVYLTYPFVLSWSCLEAMSAGCAVVGSRTPPVEEVIADSENGFLVDFFGIGELAEKAAWALANRNSAEMQEVRRRARETVVARYDLQTQCLPKLLELVR